MIPPSDEEIEEVMQFVRDDSKALRMVDSRIYCRVIAHLARNLKVLAGTAKNMRDCRLIPRYDAETEEAIRLADSIEMEERE